jgi:LPXTG-motif cell wall-anchored protein
VLVATLRPAGWDVTSLPRVASNTQLGAVAKGIDPGFHVVDRSNYDGQFYWAVAVDPLATGDAHRAVDKPTYRYGHPLLGWLAWLLSGGQAGAAAAALLAACLLSLAAAASLAGELGGVGAAAFTFCSPGLLYAAVHGLAEPLLVALVLGAFVARRPWALACCALAPLAKEQLVVVPIVFALWEIRRPRRAAPWLATLLPAIAWWVYARVQLGAWFTTGDTALGAPFAGWRRAIVDAGVYAATGTDEMRLLILVGLLGLLAVAAAFALRSRRPIDVVYLVLAVIAACLAANATESLRDALRNTALLVALVPFVLGTVARWRASPS